MIDVLVVDDQQLVREGLVALLTSAPDIRVIGEASDGVTAVDLAARLVPDVVVMDVRMPVADGLTATERIVRAANGPRVLVLTTFDLDEYVYRALAAGASGFLLKDTSAAELTNAVRVVAAGEALLAPSVTRRLIAEVARTGQGSGTATLTQRESEVLLLVARGRSNAEIAVDLVLAEQTVKTYVSRILTKLDLRDRTQIVIYAYKRGLVD